MVEEVSIKEQEKEVEVNKEKSGLNKERLRDIFRKKMDIIMEGMKKAR